MAGEEGRSEEVADLYGLGIQRNEAHTCVGTPWTEQSGFQFRTPREIWTHELGLYLYIGMNAFTVAPTLSCA